MLKPKILLAIIAVIISFIKGIYFYFISIMYKYLIFPITVSIYIQALEKKGKTLLIKQNILIERKLYMYSFKGSIMEEAEALDDVFFISREVMKKTYEKILMGKLFTYGVTIILGLCLMYFYPFFPGENNTLILFSIFLMGYFFYAEIMKIMILYKKIKNEDYRVVDINIENKNYYTAFIMKESEKETIFENVYSLLF